MTFTSGVGARGSGLGLVFAIVALAATAGAQRQATAYVAARPLARGQVIASEDVRIIGAAPLGTRSPSPESRSPVVGWVTRRVIAPGEPLRAPGIAPPNVIQPGQPVAVVWREPGIELRLRGVAANGAAAGERVTVRIDPAPGAGSGTRRRLEGIAVASGLVQLQ